MRKPNLQQVRRVLDVTHESMLISTILSYARSGHATIGMIEAAIEMTKKHISFAKDASEKGLLESAQRLKEGLEQALIDGLESLREPRDAPREYVDVEAPLFLMRQQQGHRVRRQMRCGTGIIDIFDLTADEIIECKLIGTSAALGEAAGQLRRYAKSFPGSSLSIAVKFIDPDGEWLAAVLRGQGILIIEVDR